MVGACPLPVIVRASYGRGWVVAADCHQDSDLSTRTVTATATQMHETASRQIVTKLQPSSKNFFLRAGDRPRIHRVGKQAHYHYTRRGYTRWDRWNKIPDLPDDIFHNMPALTDVLLEGNRIKRFPARTWEKLIDNKLYQVTLAGR
ncbi:hypothetical protein AVEN_199943-1 [Araneus ventricosus]|uniref:Uncharacterized protein n=1 Tax=Araneus ventricosus TaxID=182803 RepID=A0A4Y2RCN0_ARAVE|nr:hypothetical protein AVEN_199943-1 [Araneus ventricosus]